MDNKEIFEIVDQYNGWPMSDFQSRYFVVNSQVTNYRRVRQAFLEIETRLAAKKQIERNVKKTNIQKKIAQRKYEQETDDLEKELILVDIEQFDYDLSVYDKKYSICLKELDHFANIIKDIAPTAEDLAAYQKENDDEERHYWITRMAKQAAMDLVTIGRIGQGNLDSIVMMPIEDQKETIKAALTYNGLLNKGIAGLEIEARAEIESSLSSMNYIEQVVKTQLNLEDKTKGEDI